MRCLRAIFGTISNVVFNIIFSRRYLHDDLGQLRSFSSSIKDFPHSECDKVLLVGAVLAEQRHNAPIANVEADEHRGKHRP